MISKFINSIFVVCFFILPLRAQQPPDTNAVNGNRNNFSGFIRGGFYGDLSENGSKPFISSGFSDIALRISHGDNNIYRFYSDLRFRYGSEFHDPVKEFTVKEAFAEVEFLKFTVSAGKRIIKWGRGDFTNPTSKLNPQNYISRSPDREDMDMGNIAGSVRWNPVNAFSLEAVAVPFYRSSVLLIKPVPLPENVTLTDINDLINGEDLFSYGIKSDIRVRGFDFGFSWFDGYDPMPGTALKSFSLDLSGPVPVSSTSLEMKPYRIRMAGFDFETAAGSLGIRGEAAWTFPQRSYQSYEYYPLEEIKWVAGFDFSAGSLRFTGEYSGKVMPSFLPSPADPIIGTEPDLQKLAELLMQPGFDINEYVRNQVGAYNRLYNYQLEKSYHSAGLRIESEFGYGKVIPSVFSLINITTGDLIVIPELKIKPADGLTINIGAEVYSGRKGSLFGIIEDYMTSIYIGIKADF